MSLSQKFPGLRGDLQVTQVDPETYELSDPLTGQSLRLDSVGFLVAEQFEQADQSLEGIRERLQAEHAIDISRAELLDFLKKADRLGFLTGPLRGLEETAQIQEAEPSEVFVGARKLTDSTEFLKIRARILGPFAWIHTLSPMVRNVLFAACVLFFFPWKLNVSGLLKVVSDERVSVRAGSEGIVEKVFVREGGVVSRGTPLAQLSGYEPEIEKTQSELEKLEAELIKLKTGPTPEEIRQMEKAVEVTRGLSQQAQVRAERSIELHRKGLISTQEMEQTVSEREISVRKTEEAEAQLALLRSGTRKELVRAKKAEIQAARSELRFLVDLREKLLIRSPIKGVVSSPDTQALRGRRLLFGDAVMDVADPERLSIELDVPERNLGEISVGREILFKVQAFPGSTFVARVIRIAPAALTSGEGSIPGSQETYFRVYGEIVGPVTSLRPGMTGVGQVAGGGLFGTSWVTVGLRFFRQIFQSLRVEYVI